MRTMALLSVFALAAAVLAAGAACRAPVGDGKPVSQQGTVPAEPGPLEAYAALREDVMRGDFIALFDRATARYRAASFPAEKYRSIVASDPRAKAMGITAQDVARMSAREAVDAYFKLLPMDVKANLAAALSGTKVLGQSPTQDGGVAVEIESGGVRSRLFFKREAGEWRMDGEERGQPEEAR